MTLRTQTWNPGPGRLVIPDRTNSLFVMYPPSQSSARHPVDLSGQAVIYAVLTEVQKLKDQTAVDKGLRGRITVAEEFERQGQGSQLPKLQGNDITFSGSQKSVVDRDRPKSQAEFRRASKEKTLMLSLEPGYKMRYDQGEARQESNYENGYKSQNISVSNLQARVIKGLRDREIIALSSALNVPGT